MKISIIVAQGRNKAIGKGGTMPWRLSADLRRFRRLTMGKPILMGRRTHESIGRPLDGRRNLVLTRNQDYIAPGCEIFHDLTAALAACAQEGECYVIGGASLYKCALPQANYCHMTMVEAEPEADVYMPELPESEWCEQGAPECHPKDASNEYAYAFVDLVRRQKPDGISA